MPRVVAGYKDQARQRILDAAQRVFRRKGLTPTMEDVAEEVGVSKAALYVYFRTKAELLAALQAEARKQVLEGWEGLLDSGDVAEGMVSSLDAIFSGVVDPAIWHQLLAEAASDPSIRRVLEADHREDTKMMRRFLRELEARGRIPPMKDPEAVTDVILMLMQGAAARVMMRGATGDTKRRLARSLRLVLRT